MKLLLTTHLLRRAILSMSLLVSLSFVYSQVSLTEEEWVIPSYPLGAPDKNPMFFKNESYQGASRHYYPYALQDAFSSEKKDKAWKALILENEYIKICVTPEMGGKIYYGTDKSNGYNFFYKNDVVKPANIGMTGAWVSGGIEWNVLHHHRASSFMPVDYELVENEDGSKTIWVGETELRHRMRWSIGITVFPGKSYVQAKIKIHNPSPYTHSFLYWANVATHTNENYQVIFPPSVQVATYHAKNAFVHWPIAKEVYLSQDFSEGVDISYWKNALRANSFFAFDLKEDFMGGYDHGKSSGTMHIGDHNIVKGAKLWEWGSGPLGQAIEGQLNENAGPYVELMVGAFSDNQPDYSWIRPYETKIATQTWYPFRDIEGFKNANLNGAVNLEMKTENQLFLAYHSTQKVANARIVLRDKDKILFEKEVEISPAKAFTENIPLNYTAVLTDLYTEMKDMESGEVLLSYQPKSYPYPEKLPETVKKPLLPEEIEKQEELFITGNRIEQFYNPRLDPNDYYQEALKRDPGDIRSNTAVGNIQLKNGNYVEARKYFSKAIERLTQNYTRPADAEALYLQGLCLKQMKLYEEAIDTLYRASWDHAYHAAAYLELARISAIQGNYEKALTQVEESLSTNARNNSAINLRTSLLRNLGKFHTASIANAQLIKKDPLDFRAIHEAGLLSMHLGEKEETRAWKQKLSHLLRDYEQNYLDLALGYMNDGMPTEAKKILDSYNGSYPIISYYQGFLESQAGNRDQANSLYTQASSQSKDYCFPFRLETAEVLKNALEMNPSDASAAYYLGNIYYNKQAALAMSYWERAVKYDPNLAIAYRNLGWAYYQYEEEGFKAIAAYEKAIKANPLDPMYYVELDQLYELANTPVSKRMEIFTGNEEAIGKREDAFARYMAILTLGGKAEQAVKQLKGKEFTFNESSQRTYDIVADAHLLLGIQQLQEKKYKEALQTFAEAEVPDELAFFSNSGKRNIQLKYFMGLAHEGLRSRKQAKNHYKENTISPVGNSSYIRFYKGLSYDKLGKEEEADEIFQALIEEATKELEEDTSTKVDFFAKFGGKESENARLSRAHMLKGLGHKGMGQADAARTHLEKAVELSANNLYAKMELDLLNQ